MKKNSVHGWCCRVGELSVIMVFSNSVFRAPPCLNLTNIYCDAVCTLDLINGSCLLSLGYWLLFFFFFFWFVCFCFILFYFIFLLFFFSWGGGGLYMTSGGIGVLEIKHRPSFILITILTVPVTLINAVKDEYMYLS